MLRSSARSTTGSDIRADRLGAARLLPSQGCSARVHDVEHHHGPARDTAGGEGGVDRGHLQRRHLVRPERQRRVELGDRPRARARQRRDAEPLGHVGDGQHPCPLLELDEPGVHRAGRRGVRVDHAVPAVVVVVESAWRVVEPVGDVAVRGVEPGGQRDPLLEPGREGDRLERRPRLVRRQGRQDQLRLPLRGVAAPGLAGHERRHATRAGLDDRHAGRNPVLRRESSVGCLLGSGHRHRVQRRAHRQAPAEESLLPSLGRRSERPVVCEGLHDPLAEERVRRRAAPLGCVGEPQRHVRGLRGLGLLASDPPGVAHPREHGIASRGRPLDVVDGVVVRRRLQDPHEHRGLRQGEPADVDGEVVARSGRDAVGAVAEVDGVEVALEDLVLGQALLEGDGVLQLAQLAGERLLGGGLLLLGSARLGQQEVLDVLLGEAGAALKVAGTAAQGSAREGRGIDGTLLVEAVVLGGEERVDHHGRHLRERHGCAVLPLHHGEGLSVPVGQHAALRQPRVEREVGGQVVPRVGRFAHGVRRRQHDRQRDAGDDERQQRGPGEDPQRGTRPPGWGWSVVRDGVEQRVETDVVRVLALSAHARFRLLGRPWPPWRLTAALPRGSPPRPCSAQVTNRRREGEPRGFPQLAPDVLGRPSSCGASARGARQRASRWRRWRCPLVDGRGARGPRRRSGSALGRRCGRRRRPPPPTRDRRHQRAYPLRRSSTRCWVRPRGMGSCRCARPQCVRPPGRGLPLGAARRGDDVEPPVRRRRSARRGDGHGVLRRGRPGRGRRAHRPAVGVPGRHGGHVVDPVGCRRVPRVAIRRELCRPCRCWAGGGATWSCPSMCRARARPLSPTGLEPSTSRSCRRSGVDAPMSARRWPTPPVRRTSTGVEFTGRLLPVPVEVPPLPIPDGFTPTPAPSPAPSISYPARPTDPVWPTELPTPVGAPSPPLDPGAEPTVAEIPSRAADPVGPGCGWAFTGVVAPEFDADVEAARVEALVAQARERAAGRPGAVAARGRDLPR